MSNLGKIIGIDFDRRERVDFAELQEDKPEKPIIGGLGKQAISEMYYQLDEYEEALDHGLAA